MYESPIQLIISEMRIEMDKKRDEAIWNAVEGIGVNVDKEELLKALQYDREQYKKGYVDGVKALAERLQAKAFRFCGNDYRTILEDDLYTVLEGMVGE